MILTILMKKGPIVPIPFQSYQRGVLLLIRGVCLHCLAHADCFAPFSTKKAPVNNSGLENEYSSPFSATIFVESVIVNFIISDLRSTPVRHKKAPQLLWRGFLFLLNYFK